MPSRFRQVNGVCLRRRKSRYTPAAKTAGTSPEKGDTGGAWILSAPNEENARRAGAGDAALLAKVNAVPGCEKLSWNDIQIASTIFAVKPGDGSAREQAASCQRVLGAGANIVTEYATKRYRSNLINWGMLPLQLAGATPFGLGDYVLIPNVREALKGDLQNIKAYVLGDTVKEFELYMAPLTTDERQILADGCLINFYKH